MSVKDILLSVLVMLIWGAQVTAVKIAELDVPPFFMLSLRFALIALILLPFCPRINKKNFYSIMLIAVFSSIIHFGCLYAGIQLVKASTSAILYQLSSIFTIILAILFLKEKLTASTAFGVSISLLGILLLFGGLNTHENIYGGALIILASLAFAIGTTLIKKLGPINALLLNGWSALFAVVPLLIVSLSTENVNMEMISLISLKSWIAFFYITLVGGVLSFFVWFQLINRNKISKLAPFTLLTPVFAVGVSQIVLDEVLSIRFLSCAFIVLLGVMLGQFGLPDKLKLFFSKIKFSS